jgi:rSAM/selenodomain-associated transferase 1
MKTENSSENLEGTALIVLVRFPSPGKVKSRLAESLGEKRAAAFYRRCAEKIFNECSMVGGGVKIYIFYSDSRDRAAVERWAGPGFNFSPQCGGCLGKRLEHALRQVLDSGAKQAVIMASDVPDLSAKIINDAVNSLADYNIVTGPSFDGGYYLLGMKSLHEELFKNILEHGKGIQADCGHRRQAGAYGNTHAGAAGHRYRSRPRRMD